MDKIRTLIVDDEPPARKRLRKLLKDETEFEIVAECGNGIKAIEAIETLEPDLVFLDIQMPEVDGFDVLMSITEEKMPMVVFVTAYDQYAVQAFKIHALDYLLKPFDRDRFTSALARIREQIQQASMNDLRGKIDRLLDKLQLKRGYTRRVLVKSAGRISFLNASEIDWIESAGNYLRVYVGNEIHLMRQTLTRMEKQLDPERFARIHRSAIVNLDRIKEMIPSIKGEFEVVLKTGRRLILTRKYRASVEQRLGRDL